MDLVIETNQPSGDRYLASLMNSGGYEGKRSIRMGRYYDDRFIAFGVKSENMNGKFPSYFLDIEGVEMMTVDQSGIGLNGTVTADTIKTDTLIAELFKKDETQVMKSKFLFSDGSRTTAGYESGSLELKVKEQAFQAGDWVEVSWANGTGFGNQIVHIDKKLTDPERYSFDTYIDPFSSWPEDATVARIAGTGVGRGNYIYMNGITPTIQGYTNVSNYNESPFGASTKDPSFEISPENIYSDGMTQVVYAWKNLGSVGSAGSLKSVESSKTVTGRYDQYNQYASSGDAGAMQVRYYHRSAYRYLTISGRIYPNLQTPTQGSAGYTLDFAESYVKVVVEDIDGSAIITKDVQPELGGEINTDINIELLTPKTFYSIKLYIHNKFQFDYKGNDDVNSRIDASYTTELREDLTILATALK